MPKLDKGVYRPYRLGDPNSNGKKKLKFQVELSTEEAKEITSSLKSMGFALEKMEESVREITQIVSLTVAK